jgi:predicted SnoaL-like aldol condensation-catalyzing enzyme
MLLVPGLAGVASRAIAGAEASTPTDGSTNEQIARDYIERVWNQGDAAAIDKLIAEYYVPVEPDDAPGREAFRARWERGRGSLVAFVPDGQYRVDLAISDGDFVCLRGRIIGNTSGGERYDEWYLSLLEIHDGQIMTEWALVS